MAELFCSCLYKEKCPVKCPKCGRSNRFSAPDGSCDCGKWSMASAGSVDEFCPYGADVDKWKMSMRQGGWFS